MKNTILLLILFFIVISIDYPTTKSPKFTNDIILYEKKLSKIDKEVDDLNKRTGIVLLKADSILSELEHNKKILRKLKKQMKKEQNP